MKQVRKHIIYVFIAADLIANFQVKIIVNCSAYGELKYF